MYNHVLIVGVEVEPLTVCSTATNSLCDSLGSVSFVCHATVVPSIRLTKVSGGAGQRGVPGSD